MKPSTRRRPLIYIDACCFGVVAQQRDNHEAALALSSLLSEIGHRQLRFADSAWLRFELGETEPPSRRRKLMSLVPRGQVFVPWDASIAREAEAWAAIGAFVHDKSSARDCRHLVSAMNAGAQFLVTHDASFFESMRQHARILGGLKPAWLVGWQEFVYGNKDRRATEAP